MSHAKNQILAEEPRRGWSWGTIISNFWFYPLLPLVLVGLFLDLRYWTDLPVIWQSYRYAFIDTLCIGGAIHLAYFLLSSVFCHYNLNRWYSLGIHVLLWLVPTSIGVEIAARLKVLFGISESRADVWANMIPTAYVISGVMIVVFATIENLQQRRREVERRELIARQETLRAQLTALQARTNPHFLFNSLNTVSSLIEEDPVKADEAVTRLSRMFRYTLEGSNRRFVPLGEELAMVRDYLTTEGLRFGERLRVELQVEVALESQLVPPLSLQPLVENAVLHGIANLREGGRVVVRASRQGDLLRLEVENTTPANSTTSHGSGASLSDLRARLDLLYASKATMEHGRDGDDLYRVRLELPLEESS